jgi:type I restriction enzyme S subunit
MKGAAIPHLDTQKLLQNITALPPLLEQHRIVSKVDELMTLCDQLEQQHINSEEAHGKLFKVLLNSLTQSKDAEEFKDNWQRISNHFDTLFTTQGSINELKQTLLELAVMGKLVPQDPNDEPARDLLKRLQEDKVKNITKASNKKDNLLPTSTDLSPFKLPYTWAYEKLGNLSSLITKGTTPTSLGFAYETNGINFIKVENIKNERINLSSIDQFISPETNNALSRSQLEEGDVLFSIAGTIGKTCIVNKEDLPANTNQALAIIRGTKQIFNQNFLLNQLNSLVSNKVKEKARGGAMNNVSLSDLSELIVVIPPTHEQDRIITKLDELMCLCDELKSRIQQASAKQKQMADALVSQALH